jgi:hypothetical protein
MAGRRWIAARLEWAWLPPDTFCAAEFFAWKCLSAARFCPEISDLKYSFTIPTFSASV